MPDSSIATDLSNTENQNLSVIDQETLDRKKPEPVAPNQENTANQNDKVLAGKNGTKISVSFELATEALHTNKSLTNESPKKMSSQIRSAISVPSNNKSSRPHDPHLDKETKSQASVKEDHKTSKHTSKHKKQKSSSSSSSLSTIKKAEKRRSKSSRHNKESNSGTITPLSPLSEDSDSSISSSLLSKSSAEIQQRSRSRSIERKKHSKTKRQSKLIFLI